MTFGAWTHMRHTPMRVAASRASRPMARALRCAGAVRGKRTLAPRAAAGEADDDAFNDAIPLEFDIDTTSDENVLTTVLNRAIFEENYALAGKASGKLKAIQGITDPKEQLLDWRALGVANWIATRAEDLGFRYPTAIQRRAALAMMTL
jgi:hypothetical protein